MDAHISRLGEVADRKQPFLVFGAAECVPDAYPELEQTSELTTTLTHSLLAASLRVPAHRKSIAAASGIAVVNIDFATRRIPA